MANAPYIDDESISDGCRLFRRVLAKPDFSIVWDSNLTRWRPSSVAFENDEDGHPMSIALESVLTEHGLGPDCVLAGHDGFALAYINAHLARELGQSIVRDPRPPDEPAHGLVVGAKPKRTSRRMAKAAAWEVPPELPPPRGEQLF